MDEMTNPSGRRVLLVEDEFLIAQMVSDMLVDLDCVCVGPIMTLQAGIAAARKGPWAGILLVGDEPYYAKAGFSRLPPGRVSFPGPVDQNRILGLSLKGGEMLGLTGQVRRARIDDPVCAAGAGLG